MYRNLDAVTFDFHNTLAVCDEWFEIEIRQLVPEFLRWHGAKTGRAYGEEICEQAIEVYRTLRLGIMDHGIEMDAEACVATVTRDLGMIFEDDIIRQGVCAVMRKALANSVPVHGVIDAVRSLHHNGVKLGVVSSAVYHPFLEWSLEKFGIGDHFDSIITSARCGFYKSRTEIYEASLKELGANAGRTVHVGDSSRYDIETPSRLGMMTILYDADSSTADGHNANAVVSSLVNVDFVIQHLADGLSR